MFNRHAMQVSVVKTAKSKTTETTPEAPKVDYVEKIVESSKEAAKVVAGAFIVYRTTDTACKMLMHIVATKIQ